MPSKMCRYLGCTNVIDVGSKDRYCPTHRHIQVTEDKERWDKNRFRLQTYSLYDWKWKQARDKYLKDHPICQLCGREKAKIVDHIQPHRGNSQLFWDRSNWQGLCPQCHRVKTSKDMQQAKRNKQHRGMGVEISRDSSSNRRPSASFAFSQQDATGCKQKANRM